MRLKENILSKIETEQETLFFSTSTFSFGIEKRKRPLQLTFIPSVPLTTKSLGRIRSSLYHIFPYQMPRCLRLSNCFQAKNGMLTLRFGLTIPPHGLSFSHFDYWPKPLMRKLRKLEDDTGQPNPDQLDAKGNLIKSMVVFHTSDPR